MNNKIIEALPDMRRPEVIEALRPYTPVKHYHSLLKMSTEHLKATLYFFAIGGDPAELVRPEVPKQRRHDVIPVMIRIERTRGRAVPPAQWMIEKPEKKKNRWPLFVAVVIGIVIATLLTVYG